MMHRLSKWELRLIDKFIANKFKLSPVFIQISIYKMDKYPSRSMLISPRPGAYCGPEVIQLISAPVQGQAENQ